MRRREPMQGLRYGWCWEDADILRRGLRIGPGSRCLSIASAGDNTLSLLLDDPASIVAVDMCPRQLASLALRIAAIRCLSHPETLELLGARPSARRPALYARCRTAIPDTERALLDASPRTVALGLANTGRFERYLQGFGRRVLPLIHPPHRVADLLRPRARATRTAFYRLRWDSWRWRLLFRLFFSRFVMARTGRTRAHFRHVEGGAADPILARTRHALTELDPSSNPYLARIVSRNANAPLPPFLHPAHYDLLRARVDRVTWRQTSLRTLLESAAPGTYDAFNGSNVFEYMDDATFSAHLRPLARASTQGARLLYWNLLVPRAAAERAPTCFRADRARAMALHREDRAFFYGDLQLEEVA